MTKIKMD